MSFCRRRSRPFVSAIINIAKVSSKYTSPEVLRFTPDLKTALVDQHVFTQRELEALDALMWSEYTGRSVIEMLSQPNAPRSRASSASSTGSRKGQTAVPEIPPIAHVTTHVELYGGGAAAAPAPAPAAAPAAAPAGRGRVLTEKEAELFEQFQLFQLDRKARLEEGDKKAKAEQAAQEVDDSVFAPPKPGPLPEYKPKP